MLVFSTTNRRNDEAFERWRAAICEHFVPLRPEPSAPDTEVFGELESWPIAALTLTSIALTGQIIHHDSPEISRTERDVFFLTAQLSGETGFTAAGQRLRAKPGDLYLLDARRPFVLDCESRSRSLALTIPRRACGRTLPSLDRFHGLVIPSTDSIGSLIREYMNCVSNVDDSLFVTEREDIADHLIRLIGHTLTRNDTGVAPRCVAASKASYDKACRIIDHELGDHELNPSRLAKELGVSLRHLQVVFESQGTSPMRAILERRVAVARKMLRDPEHAQATITEIAFECGFGDLTHFGRVIAACTGLTPREFRRSNKN